MAAGTVDPGSGGIAGDLVTAGDVTADDAVSRWRIRVDPQACIGSGSCAAVAPRHFRWDGHTSVPVDDVVPPDDDVLAAADTCPAEAITVLPVE